MIAMTSPSARPISVISLTGSRATPAPGIARGQVGDLQPPVVEFGIRHGNPLVPPLTAREANGADRKRFNVGAGGVE